MTRQRPQSRLPRRRQTRGSRATGFVVVALSLTTGCLDRPVALQQPSSSSVSTLLYRNDKVDKIDLLFMIDNSRSMADKQQILALAVPDLVDRLTNPICVDKATTEPIGTRVEPGQPCPDPTTQRREFEAVEDIHIGMITSSLGGHGANVCNGQDRSAEYEADMAHLVTRGSPVDVPGGFLDWNPISSDTTGLVQTFTHVVRGAGENGCGFEASLESWYRFLVDPAPYERMERKPCFEGGPADCSFPVGVDSDLLAQRRDFLRPDSLLAVVMLTDENDCSIAAGPESYLGIEGTVQMRGTAACEQDPWSEDCQSCCGVDPKVYPECEGGCVRSATSPPDYNLRCFDQKRRFGMSFLHPIRRYVGGLTARELADGTLNPLFCREYATSLDPTTGEQVTDPTRCAHIPRDPGLVFMAGIVGVPWQDIARDPTSLRAGYRPAEELSFTASDFLENGQTPPPGVDDETSLWNIILGGVVQDPRASNLHEIDPRVMPKDPLMRESTAPRSGVNPITGYAIVDPSASSPVANPINGHEWNIPEQNDLQYACTFPLPEPIDCGVEGTNCDCTAQNASNQNPLCQNDAGEYGTMQYRAKAYPGRRQLAVLKGVGAQAIVASICPSHLDPTQAEASDWGYRPAMSAIVDRLKTALGGTCWADKLKPDSEGQVRCVVLEATKLEGPDPTACPPCTGVRKEVSARARTALVTNADYIESGADCVCEIEQVAPESGGYRACVSEEDPMGANGWCYVDPAQDPHANSDLVGRCPPGRKRMIRFVGEGQPVPSSLTFVQCRTSSYE